MTTSPVCESAKRIEKADTSASTAVRQACEADRLAIFKLVVAMHAESDVRRYEFCPLRAINEVGKWIHGGIMLVAEKDGQIIGILGAKVLNGVWFSPDVVVAEDIFYVAAEHRGTRAAFMLVRELIQKAKSHGAKHIRAGVSSGMGNAGGRLYEHFGMYHLGGNYVIHF